MKKFNIYQLISVPLVVTVFVLAMQINDSSKNMKETTLSVIHARKSVRHFTDRAVSKDDLQTLVKAGMAAPSGKNEQPWAFVIVTQRAILDTLAERLPYAKMLKQASAAIVVCGDMSISKDSDKSLWVQDCAAATENILLAAEAMGLGTVWTAAYPYEDRIAAAVSSLRLPEHVIPLCVIPVGYPDGTDKPKDKWKPENVKWETWQ
ncbi:NAD(P)H nitroreductase [Bacteroidia bacterium]|nr:NAD(P)H nitroreductase [Bacteroidia bacterium]